MSEARFPSCHDLVSVYEVPKDLRDTSEIFQFFEAAMEAEDDTAYYLLSGQEKGVLQDAMTVNSDSVYLWLLLNEIGFWQYTPELNYDINYGALDGYSQLFICQCYETFYHTKKNQFNDLFQPVKYAALLQTDSSQRAKFILGNARSLHAGFNLQLTYESLLEKIAEGDTAINDQVLRNILPFVPSPLEKFYWMNVTSQYKKSVHRILPESTVIQNMSDQAILALIQRLQNGDYLTSPVGMRLLDDFNERRHRQ